jgi:GTPase
MLSLDNQMNLPVIIIFSKIDLATEEQLEILFKQFRSMAINMKLKKVPIKMKTNEDIILFSRNIQERNVLPTFFISNIKWDGLNLLKTFLSMLPADSITDELKSIEGEKIEVIIIQLILFSLTYMKLWQSTKRL